MTTDNECNRISTFYCTGCQGQVLDATVLNHAFYCDECITRMGGIIKHYEPYPITKQKTCPHCIVCLRHIDSHSPKQMNKCYIERMSWEFW